MNLEIPHICHQLSLPSHLRSQRSLSILHHRAWKRRKLKVKFTVRSNLNFNFSNSSSFEDWFRSLLSQFPSVNSLDLIPPALGLASGAAIYLSQFRKSPKLLNVLSRKRNKSVGDWILFTSPTPFNRFVVLRCPSIMFEGSEFLEDVSERLVKEDRHFLRMNSGRIQVKESDEAEEDKVVYQRVCVGTKDGGVLSLDWPANLDFVEERGLDTTLLIVPGTAQGSLERDIKIFICECLRRGCFPVVMNPRGCAGSPITTSRLFTAADSDDVFTAVQYINKTRPWTTLMAIGWGYGANMLTKYLAEVGEKTPLTAATCIDNPFDLDEATQSSPYHISLDQKLTSGLIDILKSNKELFQGRDKGFDVKKALAATSVRDFETAISMVSYGFEEIEDFYAKSSSREMVRKVKIPLLFIQNDNGTVPLFSTPRSLIAENPFTSLLLCSYLPSSESTSCRSTISWCQHVTLEWLAAVELGLLKGRHPLLKDVDVTINPSKGLAQVESRSSNKNVGVNKLLNIQNLAAFDEKSINHLKDTSEGDSVTNWHSRSKDGLKVDFQLEVNRLHPENKTSLEQSGDIDEELGEDEVANPVDGERGQVLQAAEVVMKMLDVTMPDTLTEEQKKKALTAVGRGETLMKALQDAVPEDVREKLTTAVSGILHNQETHMKFNKFLSLGQIPDVASRLKSKVQEKTSGKLISNGTDDPQTAQRTADDQADGSNKSPPSKSETSAVPESELQASENSQKSLESKQPQAMENHTIDLPDTDKKGMNDLGNNKENVEFSSEKTAAASDDKDNGFETIAKPEGAGGVDGTIIEHCKEHDGGRNQIATGEESTNKQNELKTVESSADQTRTASSSQTDDKSPLPASPAEIQMTETEGDDNVKREDRNVQQPGSVQDGPNPRFNVSLALDALTGIDDSTQVAVNSVFNVIEDMITKLENGRDNEDEDKDRYNGNEEKGDTNKYKSKDKHEIQDGIVDLVNENQLINGNKLEDLDEKRNDNYMPSDSSDDISPNQLNSEEKFMRDTILSRGDHSNSFRQSNSKSYMEEEPGAKKHMDGGKISSEQSATHLNGISGQGPLYITTNLYRDPLYKEYLRKYLISKMRTTTSLDLDTTRALFLDYFPEEGHWKLLEQREENDIIEDIESQAEVSSKAEVCLSSEAEDTNNIIEPSYIILDSERQQEPAEKPEKTNRSSGQVKMSYDTEDSVLFVKNIVLETLKVEVERRLSAAAIEEVQPKLSRDLELIADAVFLSVGQEKHVSITGKDCAIEKFGTLNGEHIIGAMSLAFKDTSYLRKILPLGVVVGSSLASLRKYFVVGTVNGDTQSEDLHSDQVSRQRDVDHAQPTVSAADTMLQEDTYQKYGLDNSVDKDNGKPKSNSSNGKTVMVGAVTAALGASALLVNHQNAESNGALSKPLMDKHGHHKGNKNIEEMSESTQTNIVTSLAEKAMSIAGPVVPTKEDGEVDQERLVAMLAELGQRGGILKLIGKMALLWGGIRGAMSLTDKLISFLRMAERPLFQRIFGFVCMVLVLWSPVVVPLLPTLMQSWGTHNSSKIAEVACIVGLYVAIMLMVALWGKRIRAYEDPLEQYGLDVNSPLKVQNFVTGLVGGVMLVLTIHSVNILCGFVQPAWPTYLASSSANTVTWIKLCWRMLLLVFRALVAATSVAVVEELLFRSWLPDEIAADFGYHHAIIISGFAFSLTQRSLWSTPGLWLLSLVLAGARQRSQGSLFLPIGLHAGILICSFFLQKGGFLTYQPNFPMWLSGSHPFQPFSGVVGLAFSLLLAIILYPSQPLHCEKVSRAIRE